VDAIATLDFGTASRLGRQWDFRPSPGLAAVVLALATAALPR
jgi:hypothetical protein